MSEAKKMLLASVGLLFTVALIFAGYSIFNRSMTAANNFGEQQDRTAQAIDEYPITKFDGYKVSGSVAINLIKEIIGSYDSITVTVKTAETPVGFTVVDSTYFSSFRNIDSSYYINPVALYLVTVARDGNDVITSVLIEVVTA